MFVFLRSSRQLLKKFLQFLHFVNLVLVGEYERERFLFWWSSFTNLMFVGIFKIPFEEKGKNVANTVNVTCKYQFFFFIFMLILLRVDVGRTRFQILKSVSNGQSNVIQIRFAIAIILHFPFVLFINIRISNPILTPILRSLFNLTRIQIHQILPIPKFRSP